MQVGASNWDDQSQQPPVTPQQLSESDQKTAKINWFFGLAGLNTNFIFL